MSLKAGDDFKANLNVKSNIDNEVRLGVDIGHDGSVIDPVNLTEGRACINKGTEIQFNKYTLKENAYYLNLVKFAAEKVALELPLYAGKILFLKQRGVLISLVFFFQPPKGE
jgi:hypothetical protein